MEPRLDVQPTRRAAARQTRQTTMRASQAQINQDVAVALTGVIGRIESLEKWRDEQDDRRERQEERRDTRDDKRPDVRRADLALGFSALMALVYVVQLLAAHWH